MARSNLPRDIFRSSWSWIITGTYFFNYLQGTLAKEVVAKAKGQKNDVLLVGDLLCGGVMMIRDVIFEDVSIKDRFINGLQCRDEGFIYGSKPSVSCYVKQSWRRNPTRKMKCVCRTFSIEYLSKQHIIIVLRISSR